MDQFRLKETIQTNNDIDCAFQIGYEKEFLVTALSPEGDIYNLLDIGEDIIEYTREAMANNNLSFTKEYSRSLMEIVTPPFTADNALQGLDILNTTHATMRHHLETVASKYMALGKYRLMLSDEGSSPSHSYITTRGEIFSGNAHQSELVLEKYKDFVEKNQNISWTIGATKRKEKFISTYNHINSFHLTFHPTYKKGQNNFERYLKSLQNVFVLIDTYKLLDIGNKKIQREHKTTSLKHNLRDLFLKKLFELAYKDKPDSMKIPPANLSFGEKYFTNFSLSLLEAGINYTSVDDLYGKWPALNLRPRVIKGMLALEVRAFGSSISHVAHDFIQDLVRFDKIISSS